MDIGPGRDITISAQSSARSLRLRSTTAGPTEPIAQRLLAINHGPISAPIVEPADTEAIGVGSIGLVTALEMRRPITRLDAGVGVRSRAADGEL